MAQHTQAHAHDHHAMPSDQRRERLFIALTDKALEQIAVRSLLIVVSDYQIADDPQDVRSLSGCHACTHARGPAIRSITQLIPARGETTVFFENVPVQRLGRLRRAMLDVAGSNPIASSDR